MSDIQKEIKDATEIYECWNWEMLSEELESGYDRGALMDLVGKYKVLLKLADSQQELIEQKDAEIERLVESLKRIDTELTIAANGYAQKKDLTTALILDDISEIAENAISQLKGANTCAP